MSPTKSPGLLPRLPPLPSPVLARNTQPEPPAAQPPAPEQPASAHDPSQAQGPVSAQEKIERMRAIIKRVLERTIEYLAGIQANIENAESIMELTQLGSGAKLLYLVSGQKKRKKKKRGGKAN
jgi:hypothetical protein